MWNPTQQSNPLPSTKNLSPFSKTLQQGEVGILLWSNASGNVGHLALEIGGANPVYASFWPKDTKNMSSSVACEGKFHSYQDDFTAEGNKEPTHYVKLKGTNKYTSGLRFMPNTIIPINIEAIITKFNQIKSKNPPWCLGGSASFGFLQVGEILGVSNCTQFVSDLLSAGGINPKRNGRFEFRASPDGLFETLTYQPIAGKPALSFEIIKGSSVPVIPIPSALVSGMNNQG